MNTGCEGKKDSNNIVKATRIEEYRKDLFLKLISTIPQAPSGIKQLADTSSCY